jgi:hypothetical protein
VGAIRFAGMAPPPATSKNRIALSPYTPAGMIDLRWETMTGEGVPVELDVEGDAPLEVVVWDQTAGVPADEASLPAARPREACQIQDGDRVLVVHHQRLAR